MLSEKASPNKEEGISLYKNPSGVFASATHKEGKLKLMFASTSLTREPSVTAGRDVWIGEMTFDGAKTSIFMQPGQALQHGGKEGEFVNPAFIMDTTSKRADANMEVIWEKASNGLWAPFATNCKMLYPGDKLYRLEVKGGALPAEEEGGSRTRKRTKMSA